ncbi:MAG: universal stress protein [Rhodopseudomonas sp.]|nr:universal stress protein [Rhodopseudomonas sp.]
MSELRSILHPTDFSDASAEAFVHALRIALTAQCSLTLLHVADTADTRDWATFPHVRMALANWGLINEQEPEAAVAERLGVAIAKIELAPQSAIDGILQYLDEHPADLIVLATQGRDGTARWLQGSVAEAIARESKTATLFVPNGARGFVDPLRGEIHLKRLLIPVDRDPKPAAAVGAIMRFAHLLVGPQVEERLFHVGRDAPQLQHHAKPHLPVPVAVVSGDPVDGIINEAIDWQPDLIAMPTAGRHGFLDALRGSTTERVIRQAPCPVLAMPV